MNRLFFRPEQSGLTKTDAAAQTLSSINPDVQLESYTMNITTIDGFEAFKCSICDRQGKSRVDMVLSCVDNYEARMTINQASTYTYSSACHMAPMQAANVRTVHVFWPGMHIARSIPLHTSATLSLSCPAQLKHQETSWT